MKDSKIVPKSTSTPQRKGISPMLANLFVHYGTISRKRAS